MRTWYLFINDWGQLRAFNYPTDKPVGQQLENDWGFQTQNFPLLHKRVLGESLYMEMHKYRGVPYKLPNNVFAELVLDTILKKQVVLFYKKTTLLEILKMYLKQYLHR